MITCFLRYTINPDKLADFEHYARVWMRLIEKYGGTHYGYFVPGEAPAGIATLIERELGYTFDRQAWGQGFAREAAGAVFHYAIRTLQVDGVVSLIDPDNVRSLRVAREFGASRIDGVRAFDRLLDRYAWPIDESS